jgi:osmotically-inducible protein OsmY
VAPTSIPGISNRIFGTNLATLTNQATATTQDQAFTAQDKTLLVQLRQTILPQLQAANSSAPVNFAVRQGVVTLTGTVPSAQVRQQIETLVTQTPGVVQVVDQLSVGAIQPGATATEQTAAAATQNSATADRDLLVRLRQSVIPELRAVGISAPIDFTVNHGVVTLTGPVPVGEQRNRIVTIVNRVPGVVQVQ